MAWRFKHSSCSTCPQALDLEIAALEKTAAQLAADVASLHAQLADGGAAAATGGAAAATGAAVSAAPADANRIDALTDQLRDIRADIRKRRGVRKELKALTLFSYDPFLVSALLRFAHCMVADTDKLCVSALHGFDSRYISACIFDYHVTCDGICSVCLSVIIWLRRRCTAAADSLSLSNG